MIDESKEADITTGEATHRISRGIHDKVIFVRFILIQLLSFMIDILSHKCFI